MAWIAPVLALAGAGVSAHSAEEDRKAQDKARKQDMERQAIEAKYSAWLDPQYGKVAAPGKNRTASAALGGATQGFNLGQGVKNSGWLGGGQQQPALKAGPGQQAPAALGQGQGLLRNRAYA